MKLLIDKNLYYSETNNPSIGDEDYNDICEMLEHVTSVLKKFHVYHSIENKESYWSISIESQKVTLDEWDMNELFAEVLDEFDFKFSLRRASYGTGCDFTIMIGDQG